MLHTSGQALFALRPRSHAGFKRTRRHPRALWLDLIFSFILQYTCHQPSRVQYTCHQPSRVQYTCHQPSLEDMLRYVDAQNDDLGTIALPRGSELTYTSKHHFFAARRSSLRVNSFTLHREFSHLVVTLRFNIISICVKNSDNHPAASLGCSAPSVWRFTPSSLGRTQVSNAPTGALEQLSHQR